MEPLVFSKWQGTGNDFILIDDRQGKFPAGDLVLVRQLCDRHFGIGSDGLILLQRSEKADFHMEFFNPDGSRSFCGNGSRCAYAFWNALMGERRKARFTAIDGGHEADWIDGEVSITLGDVSGSRTVDGVDHIHNGSPHEIVRVPDPATIDIMTVGPRRAHDPARGEGGTNVNFIRVHDGRVEMRTYERGVEAETLSCGTGVVAAGLSALSRGEVVAPVEVITRGGRLRVDAQPLPGGAWASIRLTGPVRHVFDGTWGPLETPA